ncbi:alpha/beta hydrolase family protein [Musicola paradisiaca]|uniref:Alpha/beta hydrolase n=1 Tax=Musicola paradisiaca (strain Ech703) TaxID=579405 RepID=C6C566_MUSP7|nr:alpha/beta hydrolase [Musicola paradisiaca]ACS85676.1 conserved hypothetical protein [Musicola paradisiaca Ech703]
MAGKSLPSRYGRGILLYVAVMLQTACSSPRQSADELAASGGLTPQTIVGGTFTLAAYTRLQQPQGTITFYIEGDGFAWINKTAPSPDPTPRQALGLALAAKDDSANVVYLARPCQFIPLNKNPVCNVSYWTDKRFAEEIIDSMNQAISNYVQQMSAPGINMVGYSGGGNVAALIAARRTDVRSLRTVAGNLDHYAVNQYHQVSAMPESENAVDIAQHIASIPQIHFSGSEDSIVPTWIARRFVSLEGGNCSQVHMVEGMEHTSAWNEIWPTLLAIPLPCAP